MLPLTQVLAVFSILLAWRDPNGLWWLPAAFGVANEALRAVVNYAPTAQPVPPAQPRQRQRTPIGHPDELDDPGDGF